MRLMVAAVLVLALAPAAPPRAAPLAPAVKTFGAWTATCDNLRDCVVIGSSDDGDGLFYLRLARDATAGAETTIKVVFTAPDPIPGAPDTFKLTASKLTASKLTAGTGGASTEFTAHAAKDDADGAAFAGHLDAPAFLPAIAGGTTLDYVLGGSKGRLMLQGFDDALRFVDATQGRTGTPTALIARGMTPVGQVPPPPAAPVVQAATAAAAETPPPPLTRTLLDMAKPACDPETVEAHSEVAAWTLGPDKLLVAVPCAEGAYNVSAALFTTDAKGEQPRPAMLEQPPKHGDPEADNVVVNYAFDPKALTLTSLDKGRGLGDCGAQQTWVWTGEIFALLRATELEACPGALPEDWPPIYVATRR